MEIIIALVIGFVLGKWIENMLMIRRILTNPDNMIKLLEKYKEAKEEDESGATSSVVEVTVTKEQDTFYLYDKSTDQFLSQGASIEDALENIRKRFPNKVFRGIIAKEQAEAWNLNK